MTQAWWMLYEDDQVDVMAIDRALQRLGHSVDLMVAPNGLNPEEQLRECEKSRGGLPPDLILLDINLPLGSGHETLAALKQNESAKRIPVVVISTSDQEKDVRLAFEGGVAGYFVKPSGFEEFVGVMRALTQYWSLSLPRRVAAQSEEATP